MSNDATALKLLEYWVPTVERCGLVLEDGSIIELKNHSNVPDQHLVMLASDYKQYDGQIVASWHTHPKTSANLSVMDYKMFLNKPAWLHYIIADGAVRSYSVRNKRVMIHEEDCL